MNEAVQIKFLEVLERIADALEVLVAESDTGGGVVVLFNEENVQKAFGLEQE